MTPRQKRLVPLMPKVAAGEMTKKAALLQAGYSESSANQQQSALGGARTNGAMQEALRKIGFTEDFIASKIKAGATLLKPGKPQLGYIQTGAELLDAFPSKKIDVRTDPIGYDEIEKAPAAAKTPEEARKMADSVK